VVLWGRSQEEGRGFGARGLPILFESLPQGGENTDPQKENARGERAFSVVNLG
jgi:hypothetical protein